MFVTNNRRWLGLTAIAALSGMVSVSSQADFLSYSLSGTTDFDGWDNLTRTNPQVAAASPAFPSFPGSEPWPEAIESLLTQGTSASADDDPTGDAFFDKTSGFGYPAGVSIYSSPFGNGTYAVTDTTPVAGLETVVFQIEIGSGSAGWLTGVPTLTVTTSSGETVVDLFDSGLVDSVFDPDGPFGPLTVNTFGYQWDVSGLGTILDFEVDFETAGTSTTIFALQLDQGSVFEAVPVPEPASLALLSLGALTMLGRSRRLNP